MLRTEERFDMTRLYELTDVPKEHIWYAPVGDRYDPRGTILQPNPESNWAWLVVKPNERKFPCDGSVNLSPTIVLRPLTQKEQRKILKCLDPAK
jgi:hypothetical protein